MPLLFSCFPCQTLPVLVVLGVAGSTQAHSALDSSPATSTVISNEFIWCSDFMDAFCEGALTLGTFAVCAAGLALYRQCMDKTAMPNHVKRRQAEVSGSAEQSMPTNMPKANMLELTRSRRTATENAKAVGDAWILRTSRPTKLVNSKLTNFATPARAPSTHATDALAAAVRSGKFSELPRLLDTAYSRASVSCGGDTHALKAEATQHLLSTLRACATVRRHGEALCIFHHVADRIDDNCTSVWSLLLYNAVEAKFFDSCADFVDKLSTQTVLSSYDLVNIVRYHAHWHDMSGLHRLLEKQNVLGAKVDGITRNRALAACVAEGALDVADILLMGGVWSEDLDTVGFNTLMKGYAHAGQISKCFEIHIQMQAEGLQSSEITFGILLDACISSNSLDSARRVFNDLRCSGLCVNAVHFTTFIKGLVGAGHFHEADAVFREMMHSPHTEPDLITYSTLVKAYADGGQMASAINILKQMMSRNVKTDEVIFNSLLNGCVCRPSPLQSAEVFAVFDEIIIYGLKPSAATFSILLKALVRCDAWDSALQLLADIPVRFGMETEPRLYAQLAQSCIRAGQSMHLELVFASFLSTAAAQNPQTSENINGRLLKQCLRCAKPGCASMLLDAAIRAGSPVESRVVAMVHNSTQRRGKQRSVFTGGTDP